MIHKLDFRAMGCEMMAAIDVDSLPAEMELLPNWFEGWEKTFSRFRQDSELNQVNNWAGIATQVSQDFAEVFELALNAESSSSGLVTPLVLDALLNAGYNQTFEHLKLKSENSEMEKIVILPHLTEIRWDPITRTIITPPDLHLDFGGIVKGWAAQKTAERLSEFGPTLMDAGGDIAVSGTRADGQPWSIGVANPFNPSENIEIIQLLEGGVATSGRDRRRWVMGDHWQHHIIDPRSGFPAKTDLLPVTVIAPSVSKAEMAAKTCLILGSQRGIDWLETDESLAGLFVLENGQCLTSERFNNYIWR